MSQENTINDWEKNPHNPKCDSQVIESTTLKECNNKCNLPMGRPGPLIGKIPVVLADVEVQIDLEAEIRLEETAFDIKTIDKHVCLTQCKLIPQTNKLFIGGYVQKNIQFSSVNCTNKTSISGEMKHTTVNIPFKCVTKIQLSHNPVYGKDYKTKLNVLDKNMQCKDTREDSWIYYNKPYEPVYCELEDANILETDILNKQNSLSNITSEERTFRELVEKMVIFLRIKVLQNQQIFIPEPMGNVEIVECLSEDSYMDSSYGKGRKCIDIEVGFDPKQGMIGREVTTYDFNKE
ncbi:hypothetical protein GCM10008905_23210 [Clostridium malenominatum]|uniref:DUF7852 domain-containing protein n=1 Tax=Clostridium malenominatum TaxID=1539 RepID=A0ABN1J2A0_9CLOT